MNIVDVLIILFIIVFVLKGFKNGALKEIVTFIGGVLVLIAAYFLKNPISVLLYEHLPFLKFGGLLAGLSVLNIVVYELLAFLIIASLLMILYQLLIKATNIIEFILKLTVILEIPSKIFGLVIGFIEGVIICFIVLFVCNQFEQLRGDIKNSTLATPILTSTPVVSNVIKPVYDALDEIYTVAESYKDISDKTEANKNALDIMLKYSIVDVENVQILINSGKLNIPGMQDIVDKYKVNSDNMTDGGDRND